MAWLRVETVELLPEVRCSLTDLLRGLDSEQWVAPTVCGDWLVRDVAAHLLQVELGYVARRRDAHVIVPAQGVPLGTWLSAFNEEWVAASARLSPAQIADLLDVSGAWFEEYVVTLDLDALGEPVSWAGSRPAPVWMDVAREYTERWVHQQQIREAVHQPGLDEPRYSGPVVGTFVHSLPVALSQSPAPEGRTVNLRVVGGGGGAWHAVRWHNEWDLWPGAHADAAAEVTTSVDNAWRMFTDHPGAHPPHVAGDPRLGAAIAQAVAIITGPAPKTDGTATYRVGSLRAPEKGGGPSHE